ncbi:hypothetical protein RRG08_000126 [Elysia crispata]|uniref:Centrosomal protein of 72 kDa n=1 Tax=Elysia crispata TaxID=231223 RepID=A0AAE0YV42_9GAST|nr:hypothetical protein RRG08_000126 [Elysia crispata]
MALALTESLIKSRVNLSHENLEDIKSLSLPGTFHEKILSIGTSLRKFTRVKSLDFSRNALESLEGLEHLKLLEKLNLYYNNVGSLEELTRLKHNPNLQEIDLRLNPVTRNEPDYRLYLIHMLPSLRKLDDRGVRDRERQAALTHFSSSQAAEMSVASSTSVSVKSTTTISNKGQPSGQSTSMTSAGTSNSSRSRQEMMAKLMKGPSVLVDDDVAVIDALEKNELDYGKRRSLTGSSAKEDKVEDYSLDALKVLDQPKGTKHSEMSIDDLKDNTKKSPKRRTVSSVLAAGDSRFDEYREQYPNIMAAPLDSVQRIGEKRRQDPNLQFSDEIEASSKYKGQGYFTPNPGASTSDDDDDGRREKSLSGNPKDDLESRFSRSDRTEYRKTAADTNHNRDISSHDDLTISLQHQPSKSYSAPGRERLYRKVPDIDEDQTREKNLLFSLLNLVDRYWNGSKSLHKHPKFIEQALQSLSEYTLTRINRDESRGLRKMVERLQEENAVLMGKVESHANEVLTSAESELKDALKKARQDMESMHREIRHYVQENRALQKLVDTNESAVTSRQQHSGAASSDMADAPSQRQRDALQQELEMMRSKVRQYDQVQELALMLQESHRSLVETNDHLLRELVETRQRHKHEIAQMNWNYQQLKATMGYNTGSTQRAANTISGNFGKDNINEEQPNSLK